MDFLKPLCEGNEEEFFLLEVLEEVLPEDSYLVDRVGSILIVNGHLFATTVDKSCDGLSAVL